MSKKLPCEVVQDLLPNYIEKITSEVTNKEVKEHLDDCEACEDVYKHMTEDFPEEEVSSFEEDLKKLQYLTKIKVKYIKVIVILLSAVIMAGGIFIGNINRLEYVPVDDIEVEYVYLLEDGNLFFVFSTGLNEPDQLHGMSGMGWAADEGYTTEEGAVSFLYTLKDKWFHKSDENRIYYDLVVDMKEGYEHDKDEAVEVDYKQIYLHGENAAKDKKLIWEEGMDVQKAPEKVEMKYQLDYYEQYYFYWVPEY